MSDQSSNSISNTKRKEKSKSNLYIFDRIVARNLLNPLPVGEKDIGDLRRREIAELNGVEGGLDHHVVEADAVESRSRVRVGAMGEQVGARGEQVGARGEPGSSGLQVLDDPDPPFWVPGRDLEDLGCALVFVALAGEKMTHRFVKARFRSPWVRPADDALLPLLSLITYVNQNFVFNV